ncbi:adenylyltransferase/cytidyltransferase family protein [Marinobacter sp.]|uniref:adenylyltransferase/cytidyltransferase family protein n=1 Tax=Marinobacter sp. TaxID=50741 RepID=UPI003A91D757
MKTVITYGTFDMFHVGHLRLLQRMAALGDRTIVAVSTDEFNAIKGKRAVIPFDERCEIIQALRFVDQVIPEADWSQKAQDIARHNVDTFVMGDDWAGRFDFLKSLCEVVYLPRTQGISTTEIRTSVARGAPTLVCAEPGALDGATTAPSAPRGGLTLVGGARDVVDPDRGEHGD